jgi:hypothetical protein
MKAPRACVGALEAASKAPWPRAGRAAPGMRSQPRTRGGGVRAQPVPLCVQTGRGANCAVIFVWCKRLEGYVRDLRVGTRAGIREGGETSSCLGNRNHAHPQSSRKRAEKAGAEYSPAAPRAAAAAPVQSAHSAMGSNRLKRDKWRAHGRSLPWGLKCVWLKRAAPWVNASCGRGCCRSEESLPERESSEAQRAANAIRGLQMPLQEWSMSFTP